MAGVGCALVLLLTTVPAYVESQIYAGTGYETGSLKKHYMDNKMPLYQYKKPFITGSNPASRDQVKDSLPLGVVDQRSLYQQPVPDPFQPTYANGYRGDQVVSGLSKYLDALNRRLQALQGGQTFATDIAPVLEVRLFRLEQLVMDFLRRIIAWIPGTSNSMLTTPLL